MVKEKDHPMNTSHRVFMAGGGEKFEIGNAKDFGEIVSVFTGQYRPFRTEEFCATLKQRLKETNFDPINDYVAVTGNILTVAMVICWISLNHDSINLLIWNKLNGNYELRSLHSEVDEEEIIEEGIRQEEIRETVKREGPM